MVLDINHPRGRIAALLGLGQRIRVFAERTQRRPQPDSSIAKPIKKENDQKTNAEDERDTN